MPAFFKCQVISNLKVNYVWIPAHSHRLNRWYRYFYLGKEPLVNSLNYIFLLYMTSNTQSHTHNVYTYSRVKWLLFHWSNTIIQIKLTYWGLNKTNNILHARFSNAFSWIKLIVFQLKFHWSLSPRIQMTINQHWFCQWLCRHQSIYLGQCL